MEFDVEVIGTNTTKKERVFRTVLDSPIETVVFSRVWKCCKCGEDMYQGEGICNYSHCRHMRCSSCKTLEQ